jgi:hypothetical protein
MGSLWGTRKSGVIVTDRRLVKCLDPGLQGTGLIVSLCEGGRQTKTSPAPAMSPQETDNRDLAAMEEALCQSTFY